EVNVQGTLNLLHLAVEEARSIGRPVKFLFPSSIAVYGLGSLSAKRAAGRVAEDVGLAPITMYGCGKLYCEHLGRYYARHYRQLAAQSQPAGVDFRSIRFAGLAVLGRAVSQGFKIAFEPDRRRQAIVDSWPEDVDDTRARRDWGFAPAYDLDRAFNEYLLPNVRRRDLSG